MAVANIINRFGDGFTNASSYRCHRFKTMKTCLVVIALLLSCLYTTSALFSPNSNVKMLTADSFDQEVMKSEHTYVVKFFAPWCGHCKSFAPDFEKAAKKLKNFAKAGAVDCDDKSNQSICGRFGVKGFPTVKIFYTKQKDKKRIWTDFQSQRTADAVIQSTLSRIPSFVKPISAALDLDAKKKLHIDRFYHMKNDTLPKVILFSEKPKVTDLFKALAIDFHYKLVFGQIHVSTDAKDDKELAQSLGITKFPHLLVIDAKDRKDMDESKPVHHFDGDTKYKSIYKFLSKFAPETKKKKGDKSTQKTKENAKSEIPLSKVHNITDIDSLHSHCLNFNLCLLAFIDTSVSKSDAVELQNVLAPLEKESLNMPVAVIDVGSTPTTLSNAFGIDNFPDFAVVSHSKNAFAVFRGIWESDRILQFVRGVVRGTGARLSSWSGEVSKEHIGAVSAKDKGKSKDEL